MNKDNQSITIVTAFFDIGRGNIPENQGYPSYMKRTNDTYFEYFSHLATLENDMVIFTQAEHRERILALRGDKKTTVVTIDLNIFKKYIDKIAKIQQDEGFKSKVNKDLLKNIEYWSPEYVLVTNLKPFFCYYACKKNLVNDELIAWVDFGYVRNTSTLNCLKKWEFEFSEKKLNIFSICKRFQLDTLSDVYRAILNNIVFIIGGVVVGSKEVWKKYYFKSRDIHKKLFSSNLIDDDQGLILYTLLEDKDFFLIHYLGKDNWFGVFKKFDKTSKVSILERIKDYFGI